MGRAQRDSRKGIGEALCLVISIVAGFVLVLTVLKCFEKGYAVLLDIQLLIAVIVMLVIGIVGYGRFRRE